jgi:ectoine hydroxylase-related dioxygenase (phytanoyl-CoA dioxygenase family)
MEALLRVKAPNELYHYHTKLIMKDAGKGAGKGSGSGRFAWHQDYGYWSNNGCLFPEMATVMIAIDRCHSGNGCLQVLTGSHKAGRIEHTLVGEQTGADMERVKHLQARLPLTDVELAPGDACFFHCNTLHQSGRNTSEDRRWCFLVSFNSKDNDPVYSHHHPKYTPLSRLPEDSITAAAEMLPVDPGEKDFMVPVTYMKDGATKEVAEQWQARDGASSGVQMTSTAAARRAIAEATGAAADAAETGTGEAEEPAAAAASSSSA